MLRSILSTAILSSVVTILGTRPGLSCSYECTGSYSPQGQLKSSKAVFRGLITEKLIWIEHGRPVGAIYIFRVSQAWKGVSQERVELAIRENDCPGNLLFFPGEEYMVFAYFEPSLERGFVPWVLGTSRPHLSASVCSRTDELRYSVADGTIEALGPPKWSNPTYQPTYLNEELEGALRDGTATQVRELVQLGHDVEARSMRNGDTALQIVAARGDLDVASVLIEANVNVNAFSTRQGTALHYALGREEHADMVDLLLRAGAKPDGEALTIVARRGDTESLKKLLGSGTPPGARFRSAALKAATAQGHSEVVRVLLNAGAEPTDPHFAGAIENGDIAVVEMFLGTKLELSSALLDLSLARAVFRRHHAIARLMLAAGADPNPRSLRPPLGSAAQNGDTEAIHLLLEAGAQLESRNDRGEAALLLAAKYGHVEALDVLLRAGADVHARAPDGTTPAIQAAENGDLEGVRRLIEAGANVDAVRHHPQPTALIAATTGGHLEVVSILIAVGADVNARDPVSGLTPLHWVASRALLQRSQIRSIDSAGIAHLLIVAGADLHARTTDGRTPLMMAKSTGSEKVAAALRRGGARR